MAFHDALMKMDFLPTHDNPTTTPYEVWNGYKYNMRDDPSIPFGSIVKAWIPLDDQTPLGSRCITTYYTGIASGYRSGNFFLIH